MCRVEMCSELFYAIPTLFSCFLLMCYPYIYNVYDLVRNMDCVHGDRESFLVLSIHVELVLKQMPGSVILQLILHISSEEACEDRLFASV